MINKLFNYNPSLNNKQKINHNLCNNNNNNIYNSNTNNNVFRHIKIIHNISNKLIIFFNNKNKNYNKIINNSLI